jgi:DNA-binding transcriptional MerR regulator
MKVTIPEITDKELAELLKSSGMTNDEVKSFVKRCESNCCCAEKVRILRKTRKSLLDNIHEKQALLDKLDNLIWNMEHGGTS